VIYGLSNISIILITLSQGHSPITSLYKWDFSYSSAASDKISTDVACHKIPL